MCVQSNALLLADLSEKLRNMCLKIYKFGRVKFLSAPGLAWEIVLKKNKVNVDLSVVINGRKKY